MATPKPPAVEQPTHGGPTLPVFERRWRILAVLCVPLVLVVAANSGLNVALPALARQIGATQTQLQWIVDAYALVFAGIVLPAGAVGDRFGRRRTLLTGLAVFAVGALAAPLAAAPTAVIAARAVMGVGAALVMPATLSILTTVFPPAERGRAIGVWAGFAGAGAIAGPVASGLLLEWFSWGSVFLINVPIVGLAAAGTLWLVPRSRDPSRRRLDLIGGGMSVVALTGMVFAIIEGPERGWTDPATLAALAAGVAFVLAFARWELHVDQPMIELSWFADRRFSVGAGTITLAFVAGIGFGFLLPQYLQFVLGYSPLQAGLASVPFAAGMLLAAPRSDGLVQRFGHATAVSVGLAAMAAGLAYLAAVSTTHASFAIQVPGLFTVGAAMGMATAPSTAMILSALPADRAGVGSAVNDTTRELGIAFGVAIIGSVLSAVYRARLATDHLPDRVADAARESVGAALELAQHADDAGPVGALADAARGAFTTGYRTSLLTAAFLAVGAAVGVLALAPEQAQPREGKRPAGPPEPRKFDRVRDRTKEKPWMS